MSFTLVMGYVLFIFLLIVLTSMIPTLVLSQLNILLNVYKKETVLHFLGDILRLAGTYLFLGIPLTIILYQASSFGDLTILAKIFETNLGIYCFFTVLSALVIIRLSLLMKKRYWLEKVDYVRRICTIFPANISKKRIQSELTSYLFGVFFTSLIIGMLIISFKAFFAPSAQFIDFSGISPFKYSFEQVSGIVWQGLVYLFWFLIIASIPEVLLKLCGIHEIDAA